MSDLKRAAGYVLIGGGIFVLADALYDLGESLNGTPVTGSILPNMETYFGSDIPHVNALFWVPVGIILILVGRHLL